MQTHTPAHRPRMEGPHLELHPAMPGALPGAPVYDTHTSLVGFCDAKSASRTALVYMHVGHGITQPHLFKARQRLLAARLLQVPCTFHPKVSTRAAPCTYHPVGATYSPISSTAPYSRAADMDVPCPILSLLTSNTMVRGYNAIARPTVSRWFIKPGMQTKIECVPWRQHGKHLLQDSKCQSLEQGCNIFIERLLCKANPTTSPQRQAAVQHAWLPC
jgi:hypothetical protein